MGFDGFRVNECGRNLFPGNLILVDLLWIYMGIIEIDADILRRE